MLNEKILFIDACISTHNSRTKVMALEYLEEFSKKNPGCSLESIALRKGVVEPLTKERILERDGYIKKHDYDQEMFRYAKQLRDADYIVIAAPYWDMSFPSILKVYIENVVVEGLTFASTDEGLKGLCKSKSMVYITTAGGNIGENNFGYEYFKGISKMLALGEPKCYAAEGLDLYWNNVGEILESAIRDMKENM